MARTDPPTIKLKRSVLRRVITTKLEALRRGDFYVRNHLGPECYDPIVAEAKSFLDSQQHPQNPLSHAQNPPQDPSPSLSEDFETFVQIIAASILIDASMRGENAGESDPRFIKKKKKLLTKTLRGVKFNEFIHNVWRYDCLRRGMTVPDEPEETEEDTTESNNSSEEEEEEEDEHDDSDQDNTSVTSHTSADGFSTSASNSKRHHHGSSSSSKRKRHKKEKKKLKKEKRQRRREERRRRKEEKRLKKLAEKEKKKKKRKKEEEEEDDEHEVGVPQKEAGENDKDDEMEAANGKSDESYNNNNAEDEESYYEIEHATKEEFEAFREDILSKIPKKVKRRFREGGFSRWGKDWLPVLEIGPFDVEPGPVRRMWMEMFHNTRQSGREMTRLVFWYGVKFEDRGQAYSFVPSSKIITYEEGEQGGYCNMPKKIQSKIDKRIKLTKTEEQIMRGLKEIKADMAKDKSERIQWMMHFQEDYELAESMLDPEPELEPVKPMATEDADHGSGEMKIKRKPGRPKKSETFDDEGKSKNDSADLTAPIKRKPGRPKKSESSVATSDGLDAPIKRKPGRPKKTDSEKLKPKEKSKPVEKSKLTSEPEHKPKKFVIVDEDNDFALESDDDEQDKDYNEDSSDEISLKDSDDADDEQSDKESRKRKALDQLKKLKKKSKASLTEEDEDEERRRKAAEYREKKLKEKADALGLDYVPRRKKPKTNVYEEEQNRFSECEDVFLPLIDQLQGAKDDHNVKAVLETIEKLIKNVEILTPPFLRSYPLGMLVRDVRKSFESSDPEVKEHCKRLTNEMKRVYSQKEKSTPDDFVPKKRAERGASSEVSEGPKKVESENYIVDVEAVKTEDTTEQATIQSNADTTTNHDQTLRPAESDLVKPEPAKPLKKTFSIKGMFEKPKPTPKPKIIPAAIVSGPVSPKPKSLPSWVTGPAVKMDDFHEHHAKERNFALEFLTDAASTIPSNKVDPMSISQSLELAIFAETKLRGRDWNRYWEKVHDVVAMISPGTNQPNSITLGIARGDYQDPSQLVTLSRREIHSLNQQRLKSLI